MQDNLSLIPVAVMRRPPQTNLDFDGDGTAAAFFGARHTEPERENPGEDSPSGAALVATCRLLGPS